MNRLFAFAVFLSILGFSAQSFASDELETKALIAQKNLEMKQILNQDKRTLAAINYLHKHISEDARFRLTVNNPVLPIDPGQTFEVNKETYINTYIQGTNFIDQYQFDIKTVSVEIDPATNEAVTEDILTESGVMLNPYNLNAPGKPFVSRTRCKTVQAVVEGALVSKGGACHTEVSFEEEV
jgi:hypothetical protein